MAGVESRSFDTPDETRTPRKTKVERVRIGGSDRRPDDPRAGLDVGGMHQADRRH